MEGWKTLKHALELFDIGETRLREWADDEIVRTVKLGPKRQDRKIYCLADIAEAIDDMSRGITPKRRRRIGRRR